MNFLQLKKMAWLGLGYAVAAAVSSVGRINGSEQAATVAGVAAAGSQVSSVCGTGSPELSGALEAVVEGPTGSGQQNLVTLHQEIIDRMKDHVNAANELARLINTDYKEQESAFQKIQVDSSKTIKENCQVFINQGRISPYKFLVPCLSVRVKFTNR